MPSKLKKQWGRIKRKYLGAERGHKALLDEQSRQLLERFEQPVALETGCIRQLNEGTESTLTIARNLQDKATFYSFELRPEHIAVSRDCCGEYDRFVNYIEGDSVANLQSAAADGRLAAVHFAFLDSANDGDHIFNEFKAIEDAFISGGILIVDDVLWADKGRTLVPYIEASSDWTSEVFNVENGMMVAHRR